MSVEVASLHLAAEDLSSLEAELRGAAFNVKTAGNLVRFIYDETKAALRRHVEEDVYKAGKPPRVYIRRSEHEGYGTPLNDIEANSFPIGTIDRDGNIVVGINYMPSGSHSGKFGDFYSEEALRDLHKKASDPVKPEALAKHGNELIRRIETGEGYDWNYDRPRPFWSNFVNEMIEGGEFEDALVRALSFEGFEASASGNVTRDSEDGVY